jgi:hypothetical protein
MKIASMQVPVPNSLLFIRDPTTLERPRIEGSPHTWSTPSCVAVSCMPDCDGDTVITIGSALEIGRADPPLVDRRLTTPSGAVIVEIVPGKEILRAHSEQSSTRVRIWTDGRRDTSTVLIGLG